jgi:tRNA G10  N-methylase Trm11
MAADWDAALGLWRSHLVRPVDKIAFRGSCVRDGRHKYKSVDIAGEIGALTVDKFGWDVDLDHFSLEIVCILFENFMVAGLSLADTSRIQFRSRLANEDRSAIADSQYVSTLRPSTAYLMLQLAQYREGDVLLDSMCGVGTIPICCAAFTDNRVFALGGELDSLPVGKAGSNASVRVTNVDISQWDSTRLPLRSKSIDKVLVDMPFGVRCGNHRLNNRVRRARAHFQCVFLTRLVL